MRSCVLGLCWAVSITEFATTNNIQTSNCIYEIYRKLGGGEKEEEKVKGEKNEEKHGEGEGGGGGGRRQRGEGGGGGKWCEKNTILGDGMRVLTASIAPCPAGIKR